MQVKVYYHDTDCGGVVYYANYLKYLEEARTEFLAERGISVRELAAGGTLFVVSRQEIDYKFPAVYGDTLTIGTRIAETTAVRIYYEHEIRNQRDQLIAKACTLLVCVDRELKPRSIPEEIKEKIAANPE
ncbi:MAG: acyl-CoA thioesterase [Candidatus Omnitrophica bacterium]|nr:acyl-CoA thioesterase [Candidatus Omnitrophota bacterium]